MNTLKAIVAGYILIILTSTGMLIGQNLQFDHITVDEGLPNGSVLDIYQDASGFIWIGTEGGISRYDSYTFRTHQNITNDTNSIDNNAVSTLCGTSGGDFLAGTFTGINYYHADKEIFSRIPVYFLDELKYPKVYKILRISDNLYLAATAEGLFSADSALQRFTEYRPAGLSESIRTTHTTSLFQDKDGILWIGTHNRGLYSYNPETKRTIEITHYINSQNTFRDNKIIHITGDGQNAVWYGTNMGLYRFDKKDSKITRYTKDDVNPRHRITDNTVLHVAEKNDGKIWILSKNGLSIFDYATGSLSHWFHDPYEGKSLNSNNLNVAFEDRQGNFWIGTVQSGLNILRNYPHKFNSIKSHFYKGKLANNDFVNAILEDSDGKIWLGTHDYGINILDEKSGRYYSLNSANTPAIKSNHIQCLMEDSRGIIWIGTYEGGITEFNPRKNSFSTFTHDELDSSSLCNDIVNYFFEDSKKRIWIATHGGIAQFLPDKRKFRNITSGNASISFTNKITEDSQGNLWISSFEGLVKYHPDKNISKLFRYKGDRDSLSDNYVYTVYCDRKDRIWIGTLSGLNLYDSQAGSFQLFNKSNGLQSNSVLTIVDDEDGNLWLGTTLGLSRFDPERKVFTNFNQRDGLVHNIFLYNSCFKSKTNTLYFGTSNGAVFFDPKEVNSIPASARNIYITSFNILNVPVIHGENSVIQQPINEVGRIVLKYTQSYISFDLTTFNFINPYSDHYSYFLEGYDFGWIDMNNEHRITYTRIPPGKYTLNIKAANNFSNLESIKKIELIIRPPVWRSGVAYLIYLTLLILTCYLLYSYFRSKTIYKHNLLLERLESEKRNEINQSKIRFFINVAHEFKTPLTLILSPLERLLKDDEQLDKSYRRQLVGTIYKNAKMLNKLISQIIDLRKLETGKVTLEAQYLEIVSLLRDISGHFNDYASNHCIQFELESNPGSIYLWIDPEKMEKIFLNLLSNAFNHTPDGGLIRVETGLSHELSGGIPEGPEQPNHVFIRVSDSGPGIRPDFRERIFERFFRIDDGTLVNPSGSGIGLSIVKDYVELHHGKVLVESQLGEGSTFTVLIPLGDSHIRTQEKSDVKYFKLSQDYSAFTIIPADRITKSTVQDGRNARILVVEDNFELRQYMLESLFRDFDVYEAADGADGLRMARELLPEIIISDVMMPKMNGFELCRAIKSDIRTSHIPLILLTVLDANTEKIYGFEEGADDYLNKPFNMDVLMARINNLIELRNKLKQQYLSGTGLSMINLVNTKTDRNFVDKASEILNKNLSKFDFTAEYFAKEIGMSRSNLHLKLKAITGCSTTEFIRDVRLRESVKILLSGKYNISEVAYLVGFNSISYYNLCFKKKYSKTPSQYLDEVHVKIVPDIPRRL